MRSLLFAVLISQIPIAPKSKTLPFPPAESRYVVTEISHVTFEAVAYRPYGPDYQFRMPKGSVLQWPRRQILSIEPIRRPALPLAPEVPTGKKTLVPDFETKLVSGQVYTIYAGEDPESVIDAAPSLEAWVHIRKPMFITGDTKTKWLKTNYRIMDLKSGTSVVLDRLDRARYANDYDLDYAVVRVLDGPYRGRTFFMDRWPILKCEWKLR